MTELVDQGHSVDIFYLDFAKAFDIDIDYIIGAAGLFLSKFADDTKTG